MKQTKFFFVLAFLCLRAWQGVYAHDIEVANADGVTIYYVWTNDKTELAVSYRGSSSTSYSNEYSGAVAIPESVTNNGKTYPVTSIGEAAFYDCSGLTSVTIPNSVTGIGNYALMYCSGLTSVTIGNNVTSLGYQVFLGCHSLTSVTIPSSVTSIGGNAFGSCSGLTSVEIPNSVTSLGDGAFRSCSGLTSVVIPNSVTSVGQYTFLNCSGLTSITIPNSVTTIGKSAFQGCNGLTSVHITDLAAWCKISFSNNPLEYAHHLYLNGSEVKDLVIPNSVTSIGNYAFSGCSGLASVTIPNSVTSIGVSTFSGCSGLGSVHITDLAAWCKISFGDNPLKYAHHLYLNGSEVKNLVIPNSVTSISNYAFLGCSSPTSLIIPNSVTSIGREAFNGCSGLKTITIPNSVTELGISAFEKCTALESVTIGENVKIIRQNLFAGCTKIKQVTSHIKEPLNMVKSVFADNVYTQATLTVPDGTTNKYLACDGWKDFVNIKEQGQQSSFILTISGNAGGKISYGSQVVSGGTGRIGVSRNQSVTLTITPDEGYEIQSVTLNGNDVTGDLYDNTYTIAQIKENFDFVVTFAVSPMYVTIQYADGGCVRHQVEKGKTYNYLIAPADGWQIHSVSFNGNDVTAELSSKKVFTTPAITSNSVLNVVFEKGGTTGVVAQAESRLRVTAHGNTISVQGAENGEQIAVYSVDGKLVETASAAHGSATITLPENETYIVKGRQKTVKVRL